MTKPTTPRTMQVLARDKSGAPSLLAISTGKPGTKAFSRTTYTLLCRPVEDGVHWRLIKEQGSTGTDPEAEVYDVLLSPTHGNSCDCRGHERWNKCKHLDCCLVLTAREAQRPRLVTCEWCAG